jgi:hypothetical protein
MGPVLWEQPARIVSRGVARHSLPNATTSISCQPNPGPPLVPSGGRAGEKICEESPKRQYPAWLEMVHDIELCRMF